MDDIAGRDRKKAMRHAIPVGEWIRFMVAEV